MLSACFATAKQADYTYITILGVAQDAGYPQTGCYAKHCNKAWLYPEVRRMPTSLGVVDPVNNQKWLFEATPALSEQWYDFEQLAPDSQYDLEGVFITHAHIGHYTGLMYFGHEVMGAKDVPVYAMPRMKQFLETNGPWSQLVKLNNIAIQPLKSNKTVQFTGLNVTPFLVPHRDEYSETVGYEIEGANKTALFIPDINKWSLWKEVANKKLQQEIKRVDYALIDATFYNGDELPGRDMAKIPHPFVAETMALLDGLPEAERSKVWFIHMNHSNPLLDKNSQAYKTVISKGYNVAEQGMKLAL